MTRCSTCIASAALLLASFACGGDPRRGDGLDGGADAHLQLHDDAWDRADAAVADTGGSDAS